MKKEIDEDLYYDLMDAEHDRNEMRSQYEKFQEEKRKFEKEKKKAESDKRWGAVVSWLTKSPSEVPSESLSSESLSSLFDIKSKTVPTIVAIILTIIGFIVVITYTSSIIDYNNKFESTFYNYNITATGNFKVADDYKWVEFEFTLTNLSNDTKYYEFEINMLNKNGEIIAQNRNSLIGTSYLLESGVSRKIKIKFYSPNGGAIIFSQGKADYTFQVNANIRDEHGHSLEEKSKG